MPGWSRKDVETWMIQAERADARMRNPGESRPLHWPDRFVPSLDQRDALKLWVWCAARGYSFHDLCSRRGHAYSTWLDRKNRAVERIAMLLNLEEALTRDSHLVTADD